MTYAVPQLTRSWNMSHYLMHFVCANALVRWQYLTRYTVIGMPLFGLRGLHAAVRERGFK